MFLYKILWDAPAVLVSLGRSRTGVVVILLRMWNPANDVVCNNIRKPPEVLAFSSES